MQTLRCLTDSEYANSLQDLNLPNISLPGVGSGSVTHVVSSDPSEPIITDLLGIRPLTFVLVVGMMALLLGLWLKYGK